MPLGKWESTWLAAVTIILQAAQNNSAGWRPSFGDACAAAARATNATDRDSCFSKLRILFCCWQHVQQLPSSPTARPDAQPLEEVAGHVRGVLPRTRGSLACNALQQTVRTLRPTSKHFSGQDTERMAPLPNRHCPSTGQRGCRTTFCCTTNSGPSMGS